MRVLRPCWLGLALLIAQAPLPAQVYPGQSGGLGLPIPRRHKKGQDKTAGLQAIEGVLRRIDQDQVVLEAADARILNFKRTDATKFYKEGEEIKPAQLRPGDHIEVEASEDDEGFLTAANVSWQEDGTAAERRRAAEPVETSLAKKHSADSDRPVQHRGDSSAETPGSATPAPQTSSASSSAPAKDDPNPADLNAPAKEDVPAVKIDADDEGPPVLKHGGKTVARKPAAAPPAAQTSQPELSAQNRTPDPGDPEPPARDYRPATTAPQRPEDAALEKARQEAGAFLETLPNYVCQELMTRYQSSSNVVSWQPLDVVSMALVYENGSESYRDIAINGKATRKKIEDLPGSWSTGEFGTVLADIFSSGTSADFEFRKESKSGGRAALLFDFSVEREHSHWRIMVASQLVTPPYKGSVWIDKETKRVLRIEMQATHIPEAFPADKVEMATDYEFVRFSEFQFLVPVHAETLACDRGTDICSRNAIDFRNYHKYSGESTIEFKP